MKKLSFAAVAICSLLIVTSYAQTDADKKGAPKLSVKKGDPPPGAAANLSTAFARVMMRDLLQRRLVLTIPNHFLVPGFTAFEAKNVRVGLDSFSFDYDTVEKEKRETHNVKIIFSKLDYQYVQKGDKSSSFFVVYSRDIAKFLNFYVYYAVFVLPWKEERDAQSFCDALNRLIAHSAGTKSPIENLDIFIDQAKAWREHPDGRTKPPDDWNKERILAEQGIKDHDFMGAIRHYDLALITFPTWPEGWFNEALLFESLGEYDGAANRMKHYLELEPGAPDAKAAREKVIVWEEKAKQ